MTQTLASTVSRKFRHGLQAVVTTDRGLLGVPATFQRNHASHLILLRTSAFGGDLSQSGSDPHAPRPWIEVDDAADIPGLLRRRWRDIPSAN